jgi:amino-acid N-acetyltransferase
MSAPIRPARFGDYLAICALLADQGLPFDDITAEGVPRFYVTAAPDGSLLACVAIEQYKADALLRSVAVAPSTRGKGLGATLVQRAELETAAGGVRRLFLLTTSADGYFANMGYRSVARGDAPSEIQRTSQFTTLCSTSAACVVKDL